MSIGLSTFYVLKAFPTFSNGPKNLPENFPDCPFLCNWVFDRLILVDESFTKTLQNLKAFVLVNYNLYGKLVSHRITNNIW